MENEVMERIIIEETERIIETVKIPNQPQIILDINEEVNKHEPDFKTIVDLVSKDIALTAKIIKVTNAPFWGIPREIKSVENALIILGLLNFKNVVLASCLYNVFKNSSISDDNFNVFYNHSLKTAYVAKYLSEHIQFFDNEKIDRDLAYLAGLFHDCGMMIMSDTFEDYWDGIHSSLNPETDITTIESNNYITNHCAMGNVIIKKWELPHPLSETILYHHYDNFEMHEDINVKKLSAILKFAEHLVSLQPGTNKNQNILFNHQIKSDSDLSRLFKFLDIDNQKYDHILEKVTELLEMI